MNGLTHFDAKGDAHMVDVGAKAETMRIARARGEICMAPETFALVEAGTAKKGDVIGVARIQRRRRKLFPSAIRLRSRALPLILSSIASIRASSA